MSLLRLVLTIVAVIFAEQTLVMLWLLKSQSLPSLEEAVLDSGLLILLLAPALYFFQFRPLMRQMAHRDAIAQTLRQTLEELESRVQERTTELNEANQRLGQSLARLEQSHEEASLLSEMTEVLQACITTEEAEDVLKRFGPRLFPTESGAVYIYRASRNLLEMAASWGPVEQSVVTFVPEDCWSLRRGRLHLAEWGAASAYCEHLSKLDSGSTLCVPLMAQGEATGVLVLCRVQETKNAPDLSDMTQRLAVPTAEHIALALSNLQLREKLRNQAIRDPLTGLFNRRYFEETFDREARRATRKHSSVGIIMIDVDNFKRFNDTYGHHAGDVVLQNMGAVLQNATRAEDIACRYGGEEFALLLADTELETLSSRAEELREAVRDLALRYQGETLPGITISCGVAEFPEHGRILSEIVAAADRSLYRAKHEGKNRVVVASV